MKTICSSHDLHIKLGPGPDMADITPEVTKVVKRSGLEDGIVMCSVIGSTGSITTIEYEPGVVEDLKRAINRLADPGEIYQHELAWHDGNGHSHVQAALLGPSVGLPVRKGRLLLGTWQQIIVINHDNRPRDRIVVVSVIGTA